MKQDNEHKLFQRIAVLILVSITALFLHNISYAQSTLCSERPYSPSWDWRSENYTLYLRSEGRGISFESPWFARYTNNDNINAFRLQIEKDYEPSAGWVLVQRDFGEPSRLINHPYFILYNKYSGILRIFVAVGQVVGQNSSAMVTLTYGSGSKRSAVLENHTNESYRRALDQFNTNIPPIQVPNVYNFDLPYWLHADFVMNYDPCVCQETQQLAFQVDLISESELKFKLNGQLVEEIDSKGSRGAFSFQNLPKTGEGIFKAGTSFHKTTKSALDIIPKIFPNVADKFPFAPKAAYNTIPGLGAVVGAASFVVGSFEDGSLEQPTVYDVNLEAEGTIETVNPHPARIFEVPGSDNLNLRPATLIEYNNPMGVFTLIETPTFIHREECQYLNEYLTDCDHYFKLKSPLKYTVNPAVDMKPGTLEIMAALVYEVNSIIPVSQYEPISCFDGGSLLSVPDVTRYDLGVKLLVSFETMDGNDVVYVSTYAADEHNSGTGLPSASASRIVNILGTTKTSGAEAWDEMQVANSTLTSNGGSRITFQAANRIILKQGARIQRNVRLARESPASCAHDIGFTNPTSFCRSSAYTSRVNSSARAASTSDEESDSIVESTELEEINIYPNPSKGVFNIETTQEIQTIDVYDFSGKRMKVVGLDQHLKQLDMRSVPNGAYLLKIVYMDGKNSTIKVMKE